MKEILAETNRRVEINNTSISKNDELSLRLANKIKMMKEALKN